MAREAVERAAASDYIDMQARTRLDLAEVLSLAGRHDEARGELAEALRLYEQKGDVVGAARARASLERAERA
jgi:tetratricopeptide (TPR) repeat protein